LILQTLPFHHRDPFDRLLIAQAKSEGLTLVSEDAMFGQYEVKILD
jgi:PIN domain nuclease of toxin-antitoxin system